MQFFRSLSRTLRTNLLESLVSSIWLVQREELIIWMLRKRPGLMEQRSINLSLPLKSVLELLIRIRNTLLLEVLN